MSMSQIRHKSVFLGMKLFQLLSLVAEYRAGGSGRLKEELQQLQVQHVLPVMIAPQPHVVVHYFISRLCGGCVHTPAPTYPS